MTNWMADVVVNWINRSFVKYLLIVHVSNQNFFLFIKYFRLPTSRLEIFWWVEVYIMKGVQLRNHKRQINIFLLLLSVIP